MTFGEFLWGLIVVYFVFLIIWMFVSIFTDILRRDDLSGWAKAVWIILIFIVPFFGILVYVIVRPKMTAQDKRLMAEAQAQEQQAAGSSAADQIAKAADLRDKGAITAEEYEAIKKRALA